MESMAFRIVLAATLAGAAWAQLPDGPGRAETEKLCKNCHELARSVSKRQDRDGWQATIAKMAAMGTKGTDQEFTLIVDYLARHFGADEVPPLNINEAPAIEIESRLGLRRSQASAILAYRRENGKFKSIEDLRKVPNIDMVKIEARKDRIVFQ
jgi:competence protein ComEA